MTMPTPRPNRQGKPIPNWRGREPQQDARDAEVVRLAFVDGLGQAEIAQKIKEQGYSPVSPDRIGQILRVHSGRDRIIQFLAAAPEYERFTARQISTALSLDISKVMYVLDGLLKKGIVEFRDVRNDGIASGDHKTKVDIHLARRARKSAMVTNVLERTTEPAKDDNELLPADAGTMSTVEVVTNVGPDQQDEAYAKVDEHIARVVENARLLQQEVNALGAGKPEPVAEWSISEWPELTKIRDRANRAQKLNAAAKLLEEAGEDDMVLALMAKTEFTPLEQEIVSLLRYFKEIIE